MRLPHEQPLGPDASGPGTLSTHRSFVVRFYSEPDPQAGQLAGRIEHVVSGAGAEFRSPEELLAFIHRVLLGREPQGAQEER